MTTLKKESKVIRVHKNKDIAEQALFRSALISIFLSIIKLIAFWFTGSLLLLAAFFDSFLDVGMSLINTYVQKISLEAPDQEHPFGHGGFQVISSLVQGIIIVFLGIILANESIRRFLGHDPLIHQQPDHYVFGAMVLVLSAAGGYLIHFYLGIVAKKIEKAKQRSLSLLADRQHYVGDAWTNLFAAIGMITVWYSGNIKFDSAFGLLGSLFLFSSAWPILKHSIHDILHNEVDPQKKEELIAIIKASDSRISSVHRLRTRQLGPVFFADFHMTLPSLMSLEEAHHVGEKVAKDIKSHFPKSDVMIHLDPDSEPEDDF